MIIRTTWRKLSRSKRRILRRSAYWIFWAALLGGILLWRGWNSRAPGVVHATVVLPALPPAGNKLVEFRYEGTKLSDVLADLSKQVGEPFEVDWQGLKKRDLTPATVITSDSAAVLPLRAALQKLGHDQAITADFSTRPVFISTTDVIHSAAHCTTVVYPVGDLIVIRDPWTLNGSRDDVLSTVQELIALNIRPHAWSDGTRSALFIAKAGRQGFATMRLAFDNLVISATPDMHFQIRELLQSLREK